MLILGLGSNLGDRLVNLRCALQYLQLHTDIFVKNVSPVYISDAMLLENAPKNWQLPFFNTAISCTTTLAPHALLKVLQNIEQQLGRTENHEFWGPRIIDIDILKWGNQSVQSDDLTIPHLGLNKRPFALWPLMDLDANWAYPRELLDNWGSRFVGEAPFHTRQVPYRIDGSIFVGALNITPDSFSDGGCFYEPEVAIAQAKHLFTAGAEVIDIGAESTHPDDSKNLTVIDEWQRLEQPVQALLEFWSDKPFRPKISIDTRNYQVAEKAIALGVDWINDVTGFRDPNMVAAVRDSDTSLVCVHSLSLPPTQEDVIPLEQDPVNYIMQWGQQKLQSLQEQGIDLSRIIFDMGIGFGNTPEQNLVLIKRAHEFKQLGVPLLVGHARKSFQNIISAVSTAERDLETAISTIDLFAQGVDYIRVHDVAYNTRAVAMQQRLDAVPLRPTQD